VNDNTFSATLSISKTSIVPQVNNLINTLNFTHINEKSPAFKHRVAFGLDLANQNMVEQIEASE